MVDVLVPLLASFVVVLLTVPWIRRYALRWSLGNKPNGRSIHPSSIPHLGGVGLTCGTVAAVAITGLLGSAVDGKAWNFFVMVMPGAALIILLGLVDDIKSLRAVQKLVVQTAGALLLAAFGVRFLVGSSLLDPVAPLSFLVTVVYLVGVINSINLIDGHDGLAAGICFISSGAFLYLGSIMELAMVTSLALALMGACLAFLVFNFPPGKIFMGDTGSLFLGLCLALISGALTEAGPSSRTTLAVAFILAVPLIDTTLAVVRRVIMRVPIFRADCLHVHHVLRASGFTPRQTLFILYLLQVLMSVAGVFIFLGYTFPLVLGSILLAAALVFFLRLMLVPGGAEEKEKAIPDVSQPAVPTLDKVVK